LGFGFVQAQLEIVHDPIACAYGLKNSKTQRWIQPAKYQEIQKQSNGYFATKIKEKWGLLNKEGKVFLKNNFDHVYSLNNSQFVVGINEKERGNVFKKMGIIDTNKIWLLPMEYSSIEPAQNNFFHVSKTHFDKSGILKFKSSIANEKGQLIFPMVDGVILYQFYEKNVYLVGDQKFGNTTVSGNVRLINRMGQQISNETYDKGGLCGENFILVKDGKYGLSDPQGKTIVPPKFDFYFPYRDNSGSLPCLHSHHQFYFTENGKKGIVDGSWKILIPAIYDELKGTNAQAHAQTSARYIGFQNDKSQYDLIDEKGQIMFEADTLILKMLEIPKSNYYELTKYKVFYFFGKRVANSMKWGIIDGQAKIIQPALFENIIIPDASTALCIQSFSLEFVPRVLHFSLNSENPTPQKNLEFLIQMDSIYLFQYEENYYPLLHEPSKSLWSWHLYGYSNPKNHGNFVLIPGNRGSYIYHKKTKKFEKVKHIDLHSGGLPIMHSETGCNLIHPTRGNVFAEEMTQISTQYRFNNRIWALNKNQKWLLYDTLGIQKVDAEFDVISHGGDTLVVQQKGLKGLVDINFKWIIKPKFRDIYPFSKHLYTAINENNEVLVFDVAKGSKIDAEYKNFIPIVVSNDNNTAYFCLEKNGKSKCFDQNLQESKLSKFELITQFWLDDHHLLPFRIYALQHEDKPYIALHKQLIYDYFLPFFNQNVANNQRFVFEGKRGSSYNESYFFKVDYVTRSAISLSVQSNEIVPYNSRLQITDNNEFMQVKNWVITNHEAKVVLFEDLFNPSHSAYQRELIAAIQSQKNDGTECFDPKCLEKGAEYFTFHPEGILLHFMSIQSRPMSVLLTKKQLANIPSARWILEYLG
jgi:hypothetical protein